MIRRIAPLVVALGVVSSAGRLTLPTPGLRGQYFANGSWSGSPAQVRIDGDISTRQLSRAWRYAPPGAFTVQWSGYLHVSRPGDYTFTLTSDDGSELYVDGRLVVDNRGRHAAVPQRGTVRLDADRHTVVVRYWQGGGDYVLEWRWALGAEPAAQIPPWRLSPRPTDPTRLVLRRVADVTWLPLVLATVVVAGVASRGRGYWPTRPEPVNLLPEGRPMGVGFVVGLSSLFVVLAVVHTWPLATNPGRLSRNDNADTLLNEWTMAWVAHQLPRDPLHLFDANIFHPDRDALAYSEALVLQGALAAPLLWFGASPVLAYNVILIGGFALTGLAMCWVVSRWTGDVVAGVAAGVIVAFNAHTITRLPHIQALHGEMLPLALLAFDGVLRTRRRSWAVWLALALVLQALASIYLLVFTITAIVVAALVRPEDWTGARFTRVAPSIAGAATLAAVALLPILLPYWTLHEQGFARSLDEAALYSASLRDYVTTPARWYSWAGGTAALFPGAVALALALTSLGRGGLALRDARARMCLAAGIVGVALSFGPAVIPGYERLYTTLPWLRAVRATSRFGYLGIVAVAVLAGFGLASLRHALARRKRARLALSVASVALLAIEPLAAPIGYVPFDGVREIYTRPRSEPGAVVVELPLPTPDVIHRNAPFMLNATAHWKPMLNGYSGFVPPSYYRHVEALQHFPSEASIAYLRATRVTHLFVHLDQLSPAGVRALESQTAFRREATDGVVALYRPTLAGVP